MLGLQMHVTVILFYFFNVGSGDWTRASEANTLQTASFLKFLVLYVPGGSS